MAWYIRIAYVCVLVVCASRADQINEQGEQTPISDCKSGQALIGGSCTDCPKGTYYNSGSASCSSCPLDTYSNSSNSLQCTECEEGKHTTDLGSVDQDYCVEICTIPESTSAIYQTEGQGEHYLKPGDRVKAGTELFFVCFNGYNIAEYQHVDYITILCSRTTASKLPTKCTQQNSVNTDGLICYDNCYKRVTAGETQYLTMEYEKLRSVEKCSYTQCQGKNDTCMTISYQENAVQETQYLCKEAAATQSAICNELKKAECAVTQCNTDKCNAPSSSASRPLYFVHVILAALVLVVLL